MKRQGRKNRRPGALLLSAAVLFCLLFPPLAGVLLSGGDLSRYLEFPPQTRYVEHAPFSPGMFTVALLVYPVVGLLLYRYYWRYPQHAGSDRRFLLPWWFFAGGLANGIFWLLAWTRFPWFSRWQACTFTPLWLSYILLISGWTRYRQGSSLLDRKPGLLGMLFPVSALFWWYFEYVNRFVQNWYYLGVADFSPAAYVLHATLCFSTVLPAVTVTTELLLTFPGLHRSLPSDDWMTGFGSRIVGAGLLFVSMAGLLLLACLPDQLFPLVWIAPLLVIIGLQMIVGQPTIVAYPSRNILVAAALAALVCGFFWEMWNWRSLAHWEYSIPYVDHWHLFAMPLPGYLGYLPFGLECLAVVGLVTNGVGGVFQMDVQESN